MSYAVHAAARTPRRPARAVDRGALSLELAVLAPMVMLLLFTIIQAALWFHARNVALSAAQQGVEAARVRGASPGSGTAEARDFLARAGGSLEGVRVSASGSGSAVRITVTGHVSSLVPGLELPVDQYAEGPRERVTQP